MPIAQEPQRIEVQAWADEAAEALHSVSINGTPASARPTKVTISIALDEDARTARQRKEARAQEAEDASHPRNDKRDSMKRREALLKGRDGTRRRQRWENGMCIARYEVSPVLGCPQPVLRPIRQTPIQNTA